MEKGTQTLLENYVSIYGGPTKEMQYTYRCRKKQSERESLP